MLTDETNPEAEPVSKDKRKAKGRLLQKLWKRAADVKAERFDKVGDEIAKYGYGSQAGEVFDYQSWDASASFGAKVGKTHQAIQVLGSYLYPIDPSRRMSIWDWATPRQIMRAELTESHLNFSAKQGDFRRETKRTVDDAIVYGLGVQWHGLDPDKEGVTVSVHDSVKNFMMDGDARSMKELKWVGRKRFKPRWELIRQYPQYRNEILEAEAVKARSEQDEAASAGKDTNDIVEIHEMYFRVGLERYERSSPEEANPETGQVEFQDEHLRFVTMGECLLDESPWAVPFHAIGDWPCSMLSFIENPNGVWPISMLEPGLGWQRAINWAATQMVTQFKWSSRLVFAILIANGISLDQDAIDEIANSDDPISLLQIKTAGLSSADGPIPQVNHLLQRIDMSSDENKTMELLDYMSDQYEKATGLYDILIGGSTDRQLRSAQEASLKERNSTSRINTAKHELRHYLGECARKEALTARVLLDELDLRTIFGYEAAKAWGQLRTPEQMDPAFWQQKYLQEGHDPTAISGMIEGMFDNSLTLEDWLQECDFWVESGDDVSKTPEAKLDALKEFMNQPYSALLSSQDLRQQAVAHEGAAAYYKEIGMPDEMVNNLLGLAQQLRDDYEMQMMQQQAMAAQQAAMAGQQPLMAPEQMPMQ